MPPYAIIVGQDRILRYRFSDEEISDLLESKWWTYNLPKMIQDGLDIPYEEPSRFTTLLKDLPQEKKHYIEDLFYHFELPSDGSIVNSLQGQKLKAEMVQEFFNMLKKQSMAKFKTISIQNTSF